VKKNLVLYSCLALLFGACKKNHDDSSNSSNTWTFYGNTYQAATVTYINTGNLTAATYGATSTLMFQFSSPPTSSGEMLITDSGDPTPNTVVITVARSTYGIGSTFYLSGRTNVKANVTVNGKVSVGFAGRIWVHNWGNYSDSTQLSVGTITQQ
jgi:hypothetical protein